VVKIKLKKVFDFAGGLSIGCFQCQSVNGSDPKCDDPFFNNFVENSVYQPDCKSGMKGRDGLYPASDCVKIKGNYGRKHT
jgi:hypothetical protein